VVNINQQVGLLQARSNFEACARLALKLAPTEHSKNSPEDFSEDLPQLNYFNYFNYVLQLQLSLQLTWGGML
jgi:hypothetical protein